MVDLPYRWRRVGHGAFLAWRAVTLTIAAADTALPVNVQSDAMPAASLLGMGTSKAARGTDPGDTYDPGDTGRAAARELVAAKLLAWRTRGDHVQGSALDMAAAVVDALAYDHGALRALLLADYH